MLATALWNNCKVKEWFKFRIRFLHGKGDASAAHTFYHIIPTFL